MDQQFDTATEKGFRDYVVSSFTKINTQMESLLGNGQPGRIARLEAKVRRHDRLIWIAVGGATVLGWIVRSALAGMIK
jgi:hypothetical protein